MTTILDVRLKIEAAKAELMALQESQSLGHESAQLSVDVFANLDRAWLACERMKWAKELGM